MISHTVLGSSHNLRVRGAFSRVVDAAAEVDLDALGEHALGDVDCRVVLEVGQPGCGEGGKFGGAACEGFEILGCDSLWGGVSWWV